REFLDGLRTKREELSAVGVRISEEDYRSTIIDSLPVTLSNFASAQLAAARLLNPKHAVDSDILILLISEEYDRQKRLTERSKRASKKPKDDQDEALSVGTSKGKPKRGFKPKGVCWNCGEKGHFKNKCPKPLKNDKKGNFKKNAEAANAADSDSEA